MPLHFFQDFMANEELYLRRCDLYTKDDPQDGIPTDDFVRKQLGLEKYCIEDELALNSHQGSNRLFTEMYYLSCWNLYHKEHELQMWERYAKTGVAVQTTFGQLQAAVHQFLDDSHMGVVRLRGPRHDRYNLLQFLFTKGTKFSWENEVRIAICSPDPKGGQARNYDQNNVAHREALDHLYPRHPWVFDFKRRRLLLRDIITGIAISPWAPESVVNEVKQDWTNICDVHVRIHHVNSWLVPSLEDFAIHGYRTPSS